MAKKTRMGRNLNALLGGATRTPANTEEDRAPAAKPVDTLASNSDSSNSSDNLGNTPANSPDNISANSSADSASNSFESSSVTKATEAQTTPTTQAPSVSRKSDDSLVTPNSKSASESSPKSAQIQFEASGTNSTGASQPSGNIDKSEKQTEQKSDVASSPTSISADSHPSDKLRMLGVDQITRGEYQPRRHFDPDLLQELADSIKAQGLIQPILVRAYGGKYELIAGERRWRASQLAGISDIPAIVRDMDDQSVAAVSLIENIQRADLNPLEEAQALERLCDEFSMTHQQVAEAVGRSRVAVTNLMRLLELHDDVKSMVDEGQLDMGHARALLGAPLSDQSDIAKRIIQQGLTVRAVEKLVKDLREGKTPTSSEPSKPDPNIEALGQKLSKTLGAPVSVKHQKNGSGKLEISYSSIDELDGILKHIK